VSRDRDRKVLSLTIPTLRDATEPREPELRFTPRGSVVRITEDHERGVVRTEILPPSTSR